MSDSGKLRRAAEPMVRDACGLTGIGLVIDALHRWSPAIAEGVAGLALLAVCVLWARYRL